MHLGLGRNGLRKGLKQPISMESPQRDLLTRVQTGLDGSLTGQPNAVAAAAKVAAQGADEAHTALSVRQPVKPRNTAVWRKLLKLRYCI
jgi:hypothetical protein